MFDAIQSGKYRIGSVIACLLILITLAVNIIFAKFILEDKMFINIKNLTKKNLMI